jgi:hypothetical protein
MTMPMNRFECGSRKKTVLPNQAITAYTELPRGKKGQSDVGQSSQERYV